MNAKIIYDPERAPAEHDDADVKLALACGQTLAWHYPGWAWEVIADSRGGVIHVRNHDLHGRWGYTIKMARAQSPNDLAHEVMLAGGTLLEAWGCPRGPKTEEAASDIMPEHLAQAMMMKLMRERNARKHLL